MFFEQNPKRVDVVYVVLTDPTTKTLLTVQNENGSWSLPGGKRELGESLEAAAIREAKEETGLDVEIDGLVLVRERFLQDHVIFYVFTAKIVGGNLQNGDGVEILQTKWMSQTEVYEKMPWYKNINLLQPRTGHYHMEDKKNQ